MDFILFKKDLVYLKKVQKINKEKNWINNTSKTDIKRFKVLKKKKVSIIEILSRLIRSKEINLNRGHTR